VRHVTEALRAVAGVDGVDVSLEAATATVTSREAVAHGALAAAVREAGYTVTE
jgi:copper chaperone CopZ